MRQRFVGRDTVRLTELENARIMLNTENLGFGTACNQGAALARSPYVVFLNSDAIVHENWLQPLLTHLESSPSVGAVGPLLLNTDGSIQAAGSTVLGDAVAISHGDEPADFTFPRVVDYVPAACLATRRASFHQVGGFDVGTGWLTTRTSISAAACARSDTASLRARLVVSHGWASRAGGAQERARRPQPADLQRALETEFRGAALVRGGQSAGGCPPPRPVGRCTAPDASRSSDRFVS